jgi:phosphatidate cytidylyltransferase
VPARNVSTTLKRTLFGTLVVSVVAALLWLVALTENGRPVLYVGAVLAFACLAEVSLMGRLKDRNLPVILAFPLLAVVFIEDAVMGASALHPGGALPGPTWGPLAVEYLGTLALATLVHVLSRGLTHSVGRASPLRKLFLLVLAVGLVSAFSLLHERGVGLPLMLAGLLGVAAVGAFPSLIERESRLDLGVSLGLAMWMIVPLPALAQVWLQFGIRGLIALIALSKIGDVAGYFVGKSIGKSHPFPRISPNKTTAGCVASLVAGAFLGGLLVQLGVLSNAPGGAWGLATGVAAGILINIAAQAGDLLESWVKRRAGVKDSSAWMGPSGGLLDLTDSLMLSIPAALFSWPLLFGG